MKIVRFLGIGVLLGALALPTVASAQAVDADTQAIFDLATEVRGSSALKLSDSHEPTAWGTMCDPIDPDVRARAEADLNAFDQRAYEIANRTSYATHARAMMLVRNIEHAYDVLHYPIIPDRCYVASGA